MATRDDYDRRRVERTPLDGSVAILDFGYLGLIYEMIDFSWAGALVRGPKRPPDTIFDVLLHVSNRFVECRARMVWDSQLGDGLVGIAFECLCEPASPPISTGLGDFRSGIPFQPKFLVGQCTQVPFGEHLRTN